MKKSSPKGSFFFLDFFFLTFRPRDFPSDPSLFPANTNSRPFKATIPTGSGGCQSPPGCLALGPVSGGPGPVLPIPHTHGDSPGRLLLRVRVPGTPRTSLLHQLGCKAPAPRPSLPTSSGFHSRAAYPGAPNRLPAVPSVPGSHSPLASGAPQSPLSSASEPAHLRGGSRAVRTQLGAGVRGPRRVGGAQRLERQTQSLGRGAGAQAGASSATRGHRSGPVGAPPPAAASRTGTA